MPRSPFLFERFPRLAAFPHRPLVDGPTPVEEMARLSAMTGADIYVKRDDLSSKAYGGNKTRKLEWLLGEAGEFGSDILLTAGAYGSNHVLATSIHGMAEGFGVHALLSPQPITRHVEENLRADLAAGATLERIPSAALFPAALRLYEAKLRRDGFRPYRIPHGGSSPVGALGYVEAGIELALQIERGEIPEPDRIFVAFGSGGTAAGLAIGLGALGLVTPIEAVRVTPGIVANAKTIERLVKNTAQLLRAADPAFPDLGDAAAKRVFINDEQFGEGYGTRSEDAERARELAYADGIRTEGTYTARALAALIKRAERTRERRFLFISTLNSRDLSHLLVKVPVAPAAFIEPPRSLFQRLRG